MAAADVFVDTSGFAALWNSSDEHHEAAVALQRKLLSERRQFVTSEYIVDETATLLLVRHSSAAARDFVASVERTRALRLEWIGRERFFAGASLFRRHTDKEWSFTDCVSFALMRELRIRDAFTADQHFHQAGFVPLLRSSNRLNCSCGEQYNYCAEQADSASTPISRFTDLAHSR